MWAMVYHGQGDVAVVPDRPYFCTEHDLLARVVLVHRCGTDVKIRAQGRPAPLDESLLDELRGYLGLAGDADPAHFTAYEDLLAGRPSAHEPADPLYAALGDYLRSLDGPAREGLAAGLRREWGRVLGHEMTIVVEHVGSSVR